MTSISKSFALTIMATAMAACQSPELIERDGLTVLKGAAVMTGYDVIESGAIAPGLSADLVVLAADPMEDVSNFRAIRAVWLRGKRFTPEELLDMDG